jgi:predicted RNase H-like HicB family nuclease
MAVVVYPVIVHKDEDSDYGISAPDIPGCVSAGCTLAEAFEGMREAICLHAEETLLKGHSLPAPTAAEGLDLNGGQLGYIDIDVSMISGELVRVNVMLPRWLIAAIDQCAPDRSRFLAESATKALRASE